MATREWSFVEVHDVVATAVPDRDMVVCGDVRRTFGEVAGRSSAIAAYFGAHGLGLRRERSELERWECGQDAIALVLHNGVEYIEAMLGAYRAHAVPFNVNQHYHPAEVRALFADVGVRAVVYHRGYGPLVSTACEGLDVLLIDVDDGSGVKPLPGSTNFEDVAMTPIEAPLPVPTPDDLYLVCTGGTTGRPKAVLWRQADIYVSGMAGTEDATEQSIAEGATAGRAPAVPGTRSRRSCTPPRNGRRIRLSTRAPRSFCTMTRDHSTHGGGSGARQHERVVLMSIVGDAYAGPMVEELRRRPYDLSSLLVLGPAGPPRGSSTRRRCSSCYRT